jgi:hypothetical protein
MQQTEFSKMCQLYFDHCYAYHEVVLRGRFVELRLFRHQLKTKILKSVWTFLGYVLGMYVKETSLVVGIRAPPESWYSMQKISRFKDATSILWGQFAACKWVTV